MIALLLVTAAAGGGYLYWNNAGAPPKSATSQAAPSAPPTVGVVVAVRHPVTESFEFTGRVQATDRVNLVARVSAFLDEKLFEEGADVKKGDLVYRLERPPYEADVAAKRGALAQAKAQHENARINFGRAEQLQKAGSPAFNQKMLDDAQATERTTAAQVRSAEAALRIAEINLDYTEIRAPISGRISRTAVTIGNVVGPSSGTLATIVSQDPMYVTFPVPVRIALDLRNRYTPKGGFKAVAIRIRLPDGRMYEQAGSLDYADVTISQDTDTITLRGTIPNPVLPNSELGHTLVRELSDAEFVTVVLLGATPVEQLTIPREAVLSDQRGDFVYVVGPGDKVERRAVQLGQSTPETAVISAGLNEGERVVLEGVQRVRAGMQVAPAAAHTGTPAGQASPSSKR